MYCIVTDVHQNHDSLSSRGIRGLSKKETNTGLKLRQKFKVAPNTACGIRLPSALPQLTCNVDVAAKLERRERAHLGR